ncbi:hypothetical protein K438DRAFT_1979413 [Mycena galopus ATCC 62051]|nr:hypothetical protein K438DRAFT_1979413 [Mycena galopus ATCC 62051]
MPMGPFHAGGLGRASRSCPPPPAYKAQTSHSMASSARKDVVYTIAVHTAPSHLSKEEFEAKFDTFLDDLLAIPNFRRNLLKLEVVRTQSSLSFPTSLACPDSWAKTTDLMSISNPTVVSRASQ